MEALACWHEICGIFFTEYWQKCLWKLSELSEGKKYINIISKLRYDIFRFLLNYFQQLLSFIEYLYLKKSLLKKKSPLNAKNECSFNIINIQSELCYTKTFLNYIRTKNIRKHIKLQTLINTLTNFKRHVLFQK